jgi:hypothetical protein
VDGNVLGGIRLTGIFKIISDSLDDIPVSSRLALGDFEENATTLT